MKRQADFYINPFKAGWEKTLWESEATQRIF